MTRRRPVHLSPVVAYALAAILTFAALAGLMNLSGCAAISQGNDPAVVTAERAITVSFETVNAFIQAENDNREAVARDLPAVHAFAELVRRDAPAQFAEAREATRLYKSSRTAADGDAMNAKLARVQALARTAREYLIRIQTK